MSNTSSKTISIMLIVAGIVGLVFGILFVAQGFAKADMVTEAMKIEQIAYGGADGEIDGIIDCSSEAQVMAGILRDHRLEGYGIYSELERDDPNRETILKAMTMENSLNLAVLSFGVTDIVKASGAFMIVMGLTLNFAGIHGLTRKSNQIDKLT